MPPFAGEPSHWTHHTALVEPDVRLHCVDVPPSRPANGHTLVLIHGYPETWYCWRHGLQPFADLGFRAIAPDYRGAGASSKTTTGYIKWDMARDVRTLLRESAGVQGKVIVAGYDVGMMVPVAYGLQLPEKLEGLILFEAPVPGTEAYKAAITDPESAFFRLFHFFFHNAPDGLAEMLTAGKEMEYIQSFYDRLCYDPSFLTEADMDIYARSFTRAGAMRAGFEVYRAFHQDGRDLQKHLAEKGKIPKSVPVLATAGEASAFDVFMESQCNELAEHVFYSLVPHANHWIPEENPEGFVELVKGWMEEKKLL
ncbi:hypothetical protein JCM11641_004560 [Rhodosporidiobolus odoratus]